MKNLLVLTLTISLFSCEKQLVQIERDVLVEVYLGENFVMKYNNSGVWKTSMGNVHLSIPKNEVLKISFSEINDTLNYHVQRNEYQGAYAGIPFTHISHDTVINHLKVFSNQMLIDSVVGFRENDVLEFKIK